MSKKNKISRRKFLIGGASLIGVSALTCVGGTGLAMQQPELSFHNSSCGQADNTEAKVLVTYASQAGSTGEIAGAIGQVICQTGTAVDVRPIQTISDLTPYRAVVVGSAVHSSAWMPEALTFVETHRNALSQMPVAYFLSCLALAVANTDELRRRVASFLDPVRQQVPEVQPLDVGLFAGKLDFAKLPGMFRLLWPLVSGGDVGEGDYRDWEAIRSWTADLHPRLLSASLSRGLQ